MPAPVVSFDRGYSTYSAGLGANTPAATPTDVAVLFGTALSNRYLISVELSIQATAAGVVQYDLVKRVGGTQSAVNTAFVADTHVSRYDSSDVAMSTDGLSGLYTSNPASVGTIRGVVRSATIDKAAGLTVVRWQFGDRPGKLPVLRGVTQLFAINGAGHTLLAGEKFGVTFEWVEEIPNVPVP